MRHFLESLYLSEHNMLVVHNYLKYICFGLIGSLPFVAAKSQIHLSSYSEIIDSSNSELPGNFINDIHFDSIGNTWIGTNSGLSRISGDYWYNYYGTKVLNDSVVNDIASENAQEGNILYVGTNNGLTIIDYNDKPEPESYFTCLTQNSRINDNRIAFIEIDSYGNKWIATDSGLNILGEEITSSISEARNSNDELFNLSNFRITELKWFDEIRQMLVALKGGGVVRLKYDEVDGVSSATTYDTYWTDIISDTVNAVETDGLNQWYGTNAGIQLHEKEESLSGWGDPVNIESGIIDNNITDIHIDSRGNKWVGTANGLSLFLNSAWLNFTEEDGLISNRINTISENLSGWIWIGTNRGIQIINLNKITATQDMFVCQPEFLFSVYPNPATNYLFIQMNPDKCAGKYLIEIVGKTGQVIHKDLKNCNGNSTVLLDLNTTGIKSGIWILKITNKNQVGSFKFFKK